MTYPPPPPGGPPGGYGPPPGYGAPGGYGAPTGPGYPPAAGYGPPGGYVPSAPPPKSGVPTAVIVALGVGATVIILGAALAIVTLRGGGGDVTLTRAELEAAALTTDDLPDSTETAAGGDRIAPDDIAAPSACRDLVARFEADDEPVSLLGTYDGDVEVVVGNSSDVVTHFLVADASGLVDDYTDLMSSCDGARFTDEAGAESTVTFREGDPIDVGDSSVTLEWEIQQEGAGTVRGAVVGWTRDGTFSELGTASFNEDGTFGDPDQELLGDLAATLDDRLADVIEQAG